MNRTTQIHLLTMKALLYPGYHEQTERKTLQGNWHNSPNTTTLTALDLPTLAEGDVVQMTPFQLGTKVRKKGVVTSAR